MAASLTPSPQRLTTTALVVTDAAHAVSYLHTASTDEERKAELFTQPDDEPPDEPSLNRAGAASSGQENHVSAIAETPYLGAYLQTLSAKVKNMSPLWSLSFHL